MSLLSLIFSTYALLSPALVPYEPARLQDLSTCSDSLDLSIFNSPRRPHPDAPLRIMATSEHSPYVGAQLVVLEPGGRSTLYESVTTGGPPWGWVTTIDAPTVGTWRVGLVHEGKVLACQDITVQANPPAPGKLEVNSDPFWETRIRWERDVENLYSLWIERLFDAPIAEDIAWNPLSKVLRDPQRNLFYDHLGLKEDSDGPRFKPDCADFPYTTRAYFAWKMGLPFAMRNCRRGNAKRAPTCSEDIFTNEELTPEANRVDAFRAFYRKVSGMTHSSSPRTSPNAEKSDVYSVELTRRGLRPGTLYVDPYGHVMMVLRWYPQGEDEAGVLMTVDAQPDGTVGRRVFGRGAFQFPRDGDVQGAGWKRFRPLRKQGDQIVALSNEQIKASVDYGDFSLEQWSKGQEGFYDAMDRLISPHPMSPESTLRGAMDALYQQALRRVEAVESPRAYFARKPKTVIPMPKGSSIFLTAGPWEDYSSPSRDMRLLIAMDAVLTFPDRLTRTPERFIFHDGESPEAAATRIRALIQADASQRPLSYTRSNGDKQALSLWELMERREALELGWNPNDCPEYRWGAPADSEEAKSCSRRAPQAQQEKMEPMRAWFKERQRPLQH